MKKDSYTKMQWCEVIRVDGLSAVPQLWRTGSGAGAAGLAAGYYLVLWPAIGAGRACGRRRPRYLGPFATYGAASLLQVSALALGIVEFEAESGTATVVPAALAARSLRRLPVCVGPVGRVAEPATVRQAA